MALNGSLDWITAMGSRETQGVQGTLSGRAEGPIWGARADVGHAGADPRVVPSSNGSAGTLRACKGPCLDVQGDLSGHAAALSEVEEDPCGPGQCGSEPKGSRYSSFTLMNSSCWNPKEGAGEPFCACRKLYLGVQGALLPCPAALGSAYKPCPRGASHALKNCPSTFI